MNKKSHKNQNTQRTDDDLSVFSESLTQSLENLKSEQEEEVFIVENEENEW